MNKAFLALIGLLLLSAPAHAAETAPRKAGFVGDVDVATSYNYAGARVRTRIAWSIPLYENAHRALAKNDIRFGLHTNVTPAGANLGAYVQVQPASFFYAGTSYRYRLYAPVFTNGAMFRDTDQSATLDRYDGFDSHSAGQDEIVDLRDRVWAEDGRQAFGAHLLSAWGRLQFQVGPVFALVHGDVTRFWATLPAGHDAYFDPYIDAYLGRDETVVQINGVLGLELGDVRLLSVVTSRRPLELGSHNLSLGPGAKWTFAKRWWGIDKPAVALVLRWYLKHRWRGNDGVPWVAIAFSGTFKLGSSEAPG